MQTFFRSVLLSCAFLVVMPHLNAQVTIIGGSPSPTSRKPTRLSIDEIIKLSKAGLGDDIIIQQLRRTAQSYDLTPDQLMRLKAGSVSDSVIRVMINPFAPSAPITTVANGAPSAEPKVTPAEFPSEVGVYVKRHGKWVDVLPEIVNWKTGGVVKSIATAGIVKGDVNGHVNGSGSQLGITQPAELLIVVTEGTAVTEYQLLHLHQNSNNREFRTVTGGVMHVSSGATRDVVDFQWSKVAPRTFTIALANFSRGEYGLLPPGSVLSRNAAGSQGKMYTFKVEE